MSLILHKLFFVYTFQLEIMHPKSVIKGDIISMKKIDPKNQLYNFGLKLETNHITSMTQLKRIGPKATRDDQSLPMTQTCIMMDRSMSTCDEGIKSHIVFSGRINEGLVTERQRVSKEESPRAFPKPEENLPIDFGKEKMEFRSQFGFV